MSDTVLIIDDSLTVRMDLVDAFEAAGFHTVQCPTAAAAREAIGHHDACAIVLDVRLPDGDGVELLQEIRSKAADTAAPIVLMLSSEADVKDRIRGLQTGADEYVGKPYDTSYVIAKVHELLRLRRRASSDRTTILVIDDSVTFREELRGAFESAGYGVLTASSGEEGLRIAGTQRPDAIVVDGMLPGIDGPAVIRRLRLDAVLRDTPCMLLTASDDTGAELRALDAGADTFLRKEEDLDVILARVSAVLRRNTGRTVGDDDTSSLLSPKKILAIDDNPTYLHELADALKGEGYDVACARSGEEAIELLSVQTVDCILLDVVMPGMSGYETCQRIKEAPGVRETPLILVTSHDNRETMIRGLGAGADDYIQKSGEFEVLKARVRAQIRRKQAEDEHRRIREELLRKELEAVEAQAARQLAETRAALVEELERANQELEAFSYSVSHDLRAPLRAVSGFSAILSSEFDAQLPERARMLLSRVVVSAKRMEQLIEDLLLFSRTGRQSLSKQRLDMGQIVRETVEELRQQHADREVDVRLGPLGEDMADRALIRQVLTNLLSNAFKFTRHASPAVIEVTSERRVGEVEYTVRDNGAGFDPQYADRLFGVFQRLHRVEEFEGTGVGLSIVQRIIQRHGGRVWAESTPGHGATFRFTLPQ